MKAMSGGEKQQQRARREPSFVVRRARSRKRLAAAAAADADDRALLLLSSFELRATSLSFVEEAFEEDAWIARPDLDAPQGTRVPRRRLFRAAPFSLARPAAADDAVAADSAADANAAPYWPAGVAAFTRKGYLRGDPHFKPQNQDRAFVVAAPAPSPAPASGGGGGGGGGTAASDPYLLVGVCDGHGSDGHHVSDWLARDFPCLLARRLLEEGRDGDRLRPSSLPLPFGRAPAAPPKHKRGGGGDGGGGGGGGGGGPNDDSDGDGDDGHDPRGSSGSSSSAALVRALPPPSPAELARWRDAFSDADHLLPERCGGGGARAVVDSGSTLCAALVCGRTGRLTTAWVGDSRASLGAWRPPSPSPPSSLLPVAAGNRSAAAAAAALALTDDHKPERPDERARVLLFGGRVEPMRVGPAPGVYAGPARVWCPGRRDYPGLAMSRAFGDLGARPAGVVSEPEVRRWRLVLPPSSSSSSPDAQGGQARDAGPAAATAAAAASPSSPPLPSPLAVRPLLLVASDGVFEYLDDDEAVSAAAAGAERAAACGLSRDEAAAAGCRAVVDLAERRWRRDGSGGGYCDDITAVVALWG